MVKTSLMPDPSPGWFSLDNAANLYSAIRTKRLPWVFRISVTLRKRINAELAQKALDSVIVRFPYFKVRQRPGFFWHYLESNPNRLMLQAEGPSPCRFLPDECSNGYLLRVQAYKCRISVEFFHGLTDGAGGLHFLKSLVACYLQLTGLPVGSWEDLLDPQDDPNPEESEDAYRRYLSKDAPKPMRQDRAFRLPFPIRSTFRYSYLTGECCASDVQNLAQGLGVSVTEYLSGIYLYVLQCIHSDLPRSLERGCRKTLRLEVPVDLRKHYPTKSMRNFTLFVTPGFDMRLGWHSFEDVVKLVHHYMRTEVDIRRLNQQLARNVKPAHNIFVRGLPLLFKKGLLLWSYNAFGPSHYSGVLTNLGKVSMPESIANEIEAFTFVPSPGRELRIHGAVATFGQSMRITFGNVTDIRELERRFFGFLVQAGVHVKIRRYKDI
jgi:hypothetical protein